MLLRNLLKCIPAQDLWHSRCSVKVSSHFLKCRVLVSIPPLLTKLWATKQLGQIFLVFHSLCSLKCQVHCRYSANWCVNAVGDIILNISFTKSNKFFLEWLLCVKYQRENEARSSLNPALKNLIVSYCGWVIHLLIHSSFSKCAFIPCSGPGISLGAGNTV